MILNFQLLLLYAIQQIFFPVFNRNIGINCIFLGNSRDRNNKIFYNNIKYKITKSCKISPHFTRQIIPYTTSTGQRKIAVENASTMTFLCPVTFNTFY